jgi:FkbM family methyltransferase
MFESYAQNGEDIVLWRALRHIAVGTYVDVGAADPDDDSVTRAFYERGWHGLNVEPAPDYAARLAAARPRDALAQACAGEADGSIVLHHVLGTGLSSVLDTAVEALADTSYEVVDVEVRVRRLDDLLVEAGFTSAEPIHFLKIDVEGFEESVIRGIDLTIWRPWVIVAESTKPRSIEQAHYDWEPLLLASQYEFCLFDGLNRFYLAAEHGDLRELLSFPVSVFDQPYLTPSHAKLLKDSAADGGFEDVLENLLQDNEEFQALHRAALEAYTTQGAELERTLSSYEALEATNRATTASWNELETEHNRVLASWNELETEHNRVLASWNELETEHNRVLASYADLEQARARAATIQSLSARPFATVWPGWAWNSTLDAMPAPLLYVSWS